MYVCVCIREEELHINYKFISTRIKFQILLENLTDFPCAILTFSKIIKIRLSCSPPKLDPAVSLSQRHKVESGHISTYIYLHEEGSDSELPIQNSIMTLANALITQSQVVLVESL